MNLEPTNLFLSIVFGIIGTGYFAYGKKNNFYFMISGISLLVFTFFDLDDVTFGCVGTLLIIVPFVLTRYFDD